MGRPEEDATSVESKERIQEEAETASGNAAESEPQSASLREVFSFARTRKTKLFMIFAMLFAVVSGATMPAMAFYFAKAFEDLSASPDDSTAFLVSIREIAFSFMIMGVVILVSMTAQSTLMETAAGEMTKNMKTSWFEALLRQDMAYFDIQDVIGQATLISTNGRKYRRGVGRKCAQAIQFFVAFVGSLIYSFIASWEVTLLMMFSVAPLLFLSGYYMIKITTTQTARTNSNYAKAGAIVSTAVSAIRTILSLNAVEKMVELYKVETADACAGAIRNAWIAGLVFGSQFVSYLLSYMLVTLFGSFLLYKNVRETGCDPSSTVEGNEACDPRSMDVFGALMAISFAAAVLPQVSVALEAFAGAQAACYPAIVAMSRKVEKNEDMDIEMAPLSHVVHRELEALPKYEIDSFSEFGLKPEKVAGQIEFQNVCFAFPARPEAQVLQNFNLTIPAGKTVALVGASGSGKSCAVQLMERFYDPISGSITLDGTDLKQLNTKWLREQIGMVLQEPKLFGKSIRENISLGASGLTQERIEAAAKMAHAHHFIMSFPSDYDTQVGDLGGKLSGGQKQRIAIARVLVKNPKILLLDEATSALDSESEAEVQKALDELMKLEGVTTFVIAHRLSTIKNADVIAVVKDGVIVETGTHDDLLARRGVYSDLVEAQRNNNHSDQNSDRSLRRENTIEAQRNNILSEHNSDHNILSKSTIDPSIYSQTYFPSDETLDPDVLCFSDVWFRYPARDIEVFRGLNLTVRKGETLALVGPSGSGKSTVVQLIEAFYHPTGGSIEYHGVDIKDINIRWLRNELGLVSQEATLFNTSIEENIRYGFPEATTDQVIDAAKKANCHDFITSFPNGYSTIIGEGGSLVSCGQKQRIAIARAILKKPKVLLLDEATSALDSESEKVVQEALEKILSDKNQTCLVIAHRNADRIAYIDNGKVREIGSHERLMTIPNGRYRRLQELQNLDATREEEEETEFDVAGHPLPKLLVDKEEATAEQDPDQDIGEVSKEEASKNSRRAWLLGSEDAPYMIVGAIGAVISGLFFPVWGLMFAFMIELLYQPVAPCPPVQGGYSSCTEYQNWVADDMKDMSLKIFYAFLGLCVAVLLGNIILFWGFRTASERMNKRVRDAAFTNLLRQEVAWFDMRATGTITSHLADDAAMLHAFTGEPIRTLTVSIASVFVGLIISFVFMWPFALLTLAILPFLAFGAEMEMRTYMGEDEGGEESQQDEHSPGGIVVETLSNMRTVASLTLEHERADEYDLALQHEHPHPIRTNFVKGCLAGTGQFLQFWGFAIMFWWGGWLLVSYPELYDFRSYLISLFALFFSMYGLTVAAEGAVDREKARAAAQRIFALTDRQSKIDPLSDEGKKDV